MNISNENLKMSAAGYSWPQERQGKANWGRAALDDTLLQLGNPRWENWVMHEGTKSLATE